MEVVCVGPPGLRGEGGVVEGAVGVDGKEGRPAPQHPALPRHPVHQGWGLPAHPAPHHPPGGVGEGEGGGEGSGEVRAIAQGGGGEQEQEVHPHTPPGGKNLKGGGGAEGGGGGEGSRQPSQETQRRNSYKSGRDRLWSWRGAGVKGVYSAYRT